MVAIKIALTAAAAAGNASKAHCRCCRPFMVGAVTPPPRPRTLHGHKNIYVIAVIDKRPPKWPRCAGCKRAFNTLLIGLSHKLIERRGAAKAAL